ncbi:hypothetical protein [Amycolatopsis sp. NPDC059657]|uniref:hypothetical protein n=1 Tax=Amycolatopsis sp. NPDC059657 TaxID=3346899 RepID=UPI00366FA76D
MDVVTTNSTWWASEGTAGRWKAAVKAAKVVVTTTTAVATSAIADRMRPESDTAGFVAW